MSWLNETEANEYRRQMLVGRAKKLRDEGKTPKEIAKILEISESSARSLFRMYEETDKARTAMEEDNSE